VRVNWCDTCGGGANFGDQLTPVLLRHFGIPCTWAAPADAQLVVVGSILSKIPSSWTGTILGTGFIRAGMRRNLPLARVLAVRGALTRAALGLPNSTPLGDAGLLATDLVGDLERGDREMVLAHYVDHALAARHPGALVLDIRTEPHELVRQVAKAGLLYTSTLHGLILADALGIPHILEPHGAVIGHGYKFADYATALGETVRPFRRRLSSRESVALCQERLRQAFALLH
jgi:pyruvyltransferase